MVQTTYGMVLVGVIAGAMGGFAASFITGTPSIAQQSDVVVRAQQFSDENDSRGVWIGVARETGLAVRDVDGRTLLVLSVDDNGNPSLVVSDRDRNIRAFQPER